MKSSVDVFRSLATKCAAFQCYLTCSRAQGVLEMKVLTGFPFCGVRYSA